MQALVETPQQEVTLLSHDTRPLIRGRENLRFGFPRGSSNRTSGKHAPWVLFSAARYTSKSASPSIVTIAASELKTALCWIGTGDCTLDKFEPKMVLYHAAIVHLTPKSEHHAWRGSALKAG
jgi:hypothetical protein